MIKLIVIVPAFNEARVIRCVLDELKTELSKFANYEIVVINDGSFDSTDRKAKQARVTVLQHLINRGLGGALGTGLAYAKEKKPDIVVTFDADGQHDAKDIKRVIQPLIKKKADIVIGSRTAKGMYRIPWDRQLILWGSNLVTKILFSVSTTDSQSGFRAFSKKAFTKIKIKTQEMEVSSEIFSEIHRLRLRLSEVPIRVIYTPYSRKKGQSNLNAFGILGRLLLRLSR